MERLIGDIGAGNRLLFCLAGVHGNEQGGVTALEQVMARIRAAALPLQGRFVAMRANVRALQSGSRFVDCDLNRIWTPALIEKARQTAAHRPSEWDELAALTDYLHQIAPARYEERYFLDLHETSAENGTFVIVRDRAHVQPVTGQLHVPFVLHLEEELAQSTVPYMQERWGFRSLAFEGGQIRTAASIAHHEDFVWQMLVISGCLRPSDLPSLPVTSAWRDRPARWVRLAYRHSITPEDQFRMLPGFRNFDRVQQGQVVASDRHGPVICPTDGYMLMPLYQPQGTDGFFVAVEG